MQGHILVHGHVAELERKYLPPGLRVRERHKDDPIQATWSHQSLEGGNKTDPRVKREFFLTLPGKFFVEDL